MRRFCIISLIILISVCNTACSNNENMALQDLSEESSSISDSDSIETSLTTITEDVTTTALNTITTATTALKTTTSESTTSKATASNTAPQSNIVDNNADFSEKPTISSDLISTTTTNSQTSSDSSESQVDDSFNKSKIEEAYNLYLYSLYMNQNRETIAINSTKSIGKQYENSPIWQTNFGLEYYNNQINALLTEYSDTDNYYYRYYYNGTNMYFRSGNDNESGENIYYSLTIQQFLDNYYTGNSVTMAFSLSDITFYNAWFSGDNQIALEFYICDNWQYELFEEEIKDVMHNDKISINCIPSHYCVAYINTETYYLDELSIEMGISIIENDDTWNDYYFRFHNYYGESSSVIYQPPWTDGTTFVEQP